MNGLKQWMGVAWVTLLIWVAPVLASPLDTGDRAVEIAKRARDRIEKSGSQLKSSSHQMFSQFAEKTGELQALIDTRKRLEQAGMLDPADPMGQARKVHINARIIREVGALKLICDENLDLVLNSLEGFDRAIAASVADTQATRSINSNYELILREYREKERERFEGAATQAEALLEEIQGADAPELKRRLTAKYARIRQRLDRIEQRRILYEARLKVAGVNQKISGMIREKIRQQDIPTKFRTMLTSLYTNFAKVVPVAAIGGTDLEAALGKLGFSQMSELSTTLDVMTDVNGKLSQVLNAMLSDVTQGLDGVKIVDGEALSDGAFSAEKEMEYLSKRRAQWTKG
ncbi:MAG: hypothetical protein MI747_18280 [Desulfobacterales bacterium]|nr:hypothetical protein [Desulfobacterales bacterium]